MNTSTPRREFLGWMGASALLGATPGALPVSFGEPSPHPLPASPWDMSWTKRLTGKHKLVFDAPELSEGDPILRANVIGRQYSEVFGEPPAATSRVLVLRHNGIHFAMNDAYWARFPVGTEHGFTDAGGQGLKINPVRAERAEVPMPYRPLTLDAFQKSGGIVLACQLALQAVVVPAYAAAGMSSEQALAAATADVLPGITLQPSGVFAVAVAQEAGCAFVPVS